MGKRKRNNTPIPSSSGNDNMPCPSGTKTLSKEEPYHLLNPGKLRPQSQALDAADNSGKRLNMQSSFAHQHYNLGRSIFLKRSRHFYGHQYSRRNSGNHANASTSRGKPSSPSEERLPYKFTSQSGSEFQWHTGYREKAFNRPERIKYSSLILDALSFDAVKMVCGICQKLMKRELAVAAVLSCGHVYHAECLEQTTSQVDRHDPPCPLCSVTLSEFEVNLQNSP